MIGRRMVKSEPKTCEINEDAVDRKRKSDFVDLIVCDMTLKELHERCQTKKKKLTRSSDLLYNETYFHLDDVSNKEGYVDVKPKEDESDFEKPLSIWKLKLSNKSRAKQKCIRKHVSSSSKYAISGEAVTEQILSATQDSLKNIKVEISESDSSDCQNVACVTNVSTLGSHVKMDCFRELSDEVPKRVNGGDIEIEESTSFTKELPNCVVNEVSFECLELGEPISLPVRDTPFFEISCQMDSNSVAQLPDIAINDNFQCMELINSGDRCDSDLEIEGENKEDMPPNPKDNVIGNSESLYLFCRESYPCFDPHNAGDFSFDGSPIAMEKHSFPSLDGPFSTGVDVAANGYLGTCPDDAGNKLTAMEVLENHHSVQPERPPQRLFSTRKVMSPISQEKLCQAVDANELYDNVEHFGSGLEGAKVPTSPERVIKKPKIDKKGSPQFVPKGILKVPHVSFVLRRDGTESTSIHAHAQKAIAFSQRQMHDIESLAMKLMQELNSMKNIVEGTLCSYACSSTPKYSIDEIGMAVENAAVVEETTKKWLSMMARDCNRFCKIMKSTKRKTSTASGHGVHKEKKIKFADEAGGMLCHVKVFKESPTSLLVSENDKDDQKLHANKN